MNRDSMIQVLNRALSVVNDRAYDRMSSEQSVTHAELVYTRLQDLINNLPNPVLQPWVMELPYKMQSSLMIALRGPDGTKKETSGKWVVRLLRSFVLIPADSDHNTNPNDTFMKVPDCYHWSNVLIAFSNNFEEYPLHFVTHVIHAFEIVAFKHPDDTVCKYTLKFYEDMCRHLHMNPETEAQLDARMASR